MNISPTNTSSASPVRSTEQDAHAALRQETGLALRNGIKLGLSLLATVGVAIAVRVWMPRFLGPEVFGVLHFAESFATAFFAFTRLGVDQYMLREIARQPERATEYFSGILIMRLGAALTVCALMAATLLAMSKGAIEWQLVYVFALGQFFFVSNNTLGAMLKGKGTVNELAVLNVLSKFVWGGSVVCALLFGDSLVWVAGALVGTETIKFIVLLSICRKQLNLRVRFKLKAGLGVIGATLPFYLNELAHEIYGRIDVTMISWLSTDQEVGWYGVAVNVNYVVLLLMPVMSAIMLPASARLMDQSQEAAGAMMRNVLHVVLVAVTPIALLVVLNAPEVVHLGFGEAYAPAARNLQMLAPMIPLSYMCVLFAIHLVGLDRVWEVVRISLAGMVVNPIINLFLITWGERTLGPGGAGAGAAIASVATEVMVFIFLLRAVGGAGHGSGLVRTWFKLGLAVVGIVALHWSLDGVGLWRIPLEVMAYGVLGVVLGLIPIREIWAKFRNKLGGSPVSSEEQDESNE